jgi:hypothetical protein
MGRAVYVNAPRTKWCWRKEAEVRWRLMRPVTGPPRNATRFALAVLAGCLDLGNLDRMGVVWVH